MNGKRARTTSQSGVTILETLIASVVLLVGIVGVMSLFTVAVVQSNSQGDVFTRTTEYAQDKIDQLMALPFADNATDTTVYPAQAVGGTGLGGVMAGSASVGSANPAAPAAGYVDYLDANGNLLAGAGNSFYTRVWSISTNAGGTLKVITVVAVAQKTGGVGLTPSSTLVCFKAQ
jgi:Tfp pilus assembly protein PilV